MKKTVIILHILAFTLLSCSDTKQPNKKEPSFEQFAYYKSPQNQRVFIYIAHNVTMEQIKIHAQKQPNTQGATTIVYYYHNTDNLYSDSITLAKNEHAAMEAGFKQNCIAGYWKYATGQEKFIENPY